MGRKRRRFCQKEVYFVTCRVTRGLPFAPNSFIQSLIDGLIARTQELYPGVTLCHYIVMGNHYHFVVVLESSAEQMKNFFGYLDGELASLFNRLQGIAHRKFWASRYDAKVVLTPRDVIQKIIYSYLNPQKHNLVDQIIHWPGACSFKQFIDEKPRYYKWISSSLVERLPRGNFSDALLKQSHLLIEQSTRAPREVKLEPYAWTKCFRESKKWSCEKIREEILEGISQGEKKYREKRIRKGKKVVGARALKKQSIYKDYISKSYGRNSLCISSCEEAAAQYREVYQDFCQTCKDIWQSWKRGDFTLRYPPGAFIPSIAPLASIYCPT